MRTFKVSGAAMAVIAEGVTPEVAALLLSADVSRRGRGHSYEVTLPDVQANELRTYCAAVGHELTTVEVDEDKRRAGRALVVVAENIKAAPVVPDVEAECPCGTPVSVPGAYCTACEGAT